MSMEKMSQIDELKTFVFKQLQTAASEIIGAFTKTLKNYEELVFRLEKENQRHRAKLTKRRADDVTKRSAGNPAEDPDADPGADAVGPHALDAKMRCKARETGIISSTDAWTFVTCDDFLKSVSTENCPFCRRQVPATEVHLTQKHFSTAIRFIKGGTEKFVVPCMCKDATQDRSHWHCPFCVKIINRRCNFEIHLTKQHACSILQLSYGAEKHLREHHYVQLKCKDQPGQQSSTLNRAQNLDIDFMDSYIVDVGEICTEGNIKTLDPAGEAQHTTGIPEEMKYCGKTEELETTPQSSDELSPQRKKPVQRPLAPVNSSGKKATQLPASQSPTGAHRCKACGKIFHYMYTLKTHVHAHARDRIRMCGICGKHLGFKERLVQHLQSHSKKNRCGTCGKLFSSESRLKQHKRFHRPKTLNAVSWY